MRTSRNDSSATPPEHPPYIAVVGAGDSPENLAQSAYEVGAELARAGAVVVTGGLGGVMEAAARGASDSGGTTIAILPGADRAAANRFSSIAIPTDMGEARNVLIVRSADAVIAVGGEFGTLSEIAFALKIGRPVVSLGSWDLEKAGAPSGTLMVTADPASAVRGALGAIGQERRT